MKAASIICLSVCLWAGALFAHEMPCEGTWEWTSTEYADGTVENPATVGHREELFFGPVEDNRFIRYRDETVIEDGLWYMGSVFVGPCCIEFLGTDFNDSWGWFTYEESGVVWLKLQTGIICPPDHMGPLTKVETFFQRGPVAARELSWGALKSVYR